MNFPKLKFSYTRIDTINIIIHGGSKEIELQFVRKLYDRSVSKVIKARN